MLPFHWLLIFMVKGEWTQVERSQKQLQNIQQIQQNLRQQEKLLVLEVIGPKCQVVAVKIFKSCPTLQPHRLRCMIFPVFHYLPGLLKFMSKSLQVT